MAGLGHLGVGFAAKQLAPKVPVGVLVAATMVLDLLWVGFALAGLDSMSFSPWSHSLVMAGVWSVVAGAVALAVFREARPAIVIGLLVFSHWVLDFITHPMAGVTRPLVPDIPLGFSHTSRMGLGLYATTAGMIAGEIALLAPGIALYAIYRARRRNDPR